MRKHREEGVILLVIFQAERVRKNGRAAEYILYTGGPGSIPLTLARGGGGREESVGGSLRKTFRLTSQQASAYVCARCIHVLSSRTLLLHTDCVVVNGFSFFFLFDLFASACTAVSCQLNAHC